MAKIFSFVCVYVCTIVGASFITGNEVFVYFAKFGEGAYSLLILCFFVFLISSLVICLKFKRTQKHTILEIFEPQTKERKSAFLILFNLLMLFTYFCFGAVMLAGINELFGLLTCIVIAVLSFVVLQFDLSGIVKVNAFLFPIVCIYLLGLLFLFPRSGNANFVFETAGIVDYANIFSYVTLNIILICASLLVLSQKMTKKQIILAVCLSCLIFCLFIFSQIFVLQSSLFENTEMPFLEIAKTNSAFYYFTLFVTFVAMLSSFLSSTFAIYSKQKNSKNKYFKLALTIMLMLLFSFLGFSKLITISYFTLGMLSNILICVLMFKKF